jgi:hypothetical protein
MPIDKWERLVQVARAVEPDFEWRINYLETNAPDPVKQPVTSALAKAYLSRLKSHLIAVRRGADGLKEEKLKRPELLQEILDLQKWILKKASSEPLKFTKANEDTVGNLLVSTGRSYYEARQMVDQLRKVVIGRGAPNKRPETLRMADARISQALSYKKLASNICDCGLSQHTELCADRVRKRLEQVRSLLAKYKIDEPLLNKL